MAILVIVLLVGTPNLFAPMTAHAAQFNCGSVVNNFAGYTTGNESTSYEGAMAILTSRGVLLCGTDQSTGLFSSNFGAAWTMVYGSGSSGYAQSGYFYHYGDTCVRFFGEQRQDASHTYFRILANCATPGGVNNTWQQMLYVNGSYVVRSNIDVTIMMQSPWNPFSVWTAPFSPAFSGETTHPGSDVPGTPTSPDDQSAIRAQLWSNDQWVTPCGGGYYLNYYLAQPTTSRYAASTVACDHINSWTISPN